MGEARCGGLLPSLGTALIPDLRLQEGKPFLLQAHRDHSWKWPIGRAPSGYSLWWAWRPSWWTVPLDWLAFCWPSPLVEGLGRGPFSGRRCPGGLMGHSSLLFPVGKESRCVLGTAAVEALGPEIGPCLHGAQHCPLGSLLPALCPPVPSSFYRQMSCQRCVSFCHSLCLLLECSDLSRTWKGPRGR